MRDPANLPTLLQSFFTTRLMTQRKVSPHTIASYRDTFRLLLQFAQKRLHKAPSQLGLNDLDASLVGAFLEDLENRRHNGARSRNLRLTAIRSFFRYASLEAPAHGGTIQQVLAIPNQRQRRALVGFLTRPEIESAGGTESNELAGTPRPCVSTHRRSDRSATVGDDRITARGRRARSRRTCPLPGQRTEGTLYTLGQTHGRGPEKLDAGARQRRFQDVVSQHPRRTLECRWCSAPVGTPRGAGAEELRFAAQEEGFSSRASSRRRHGVATGRRGSSGDCSLARPRIRRNHPDLSRRRPCIEGTGSSKDQTRKGHSQTLSTGRRVAGLPQTTLTPNRRTMPHVERLTR